MSEPKLWVVLDYDIVTAHIRAPGATLSFAGRTISGIDAVPKQVTPSYRVTPLDGSESFDPLLHEEPQIDVDWDKGTAKIVKLRLKPVKALRQAFLAQAERAFQRASSSPCTVKAGKKAIALSCAQDHRANLLGAAALAQAPKKVTHAHLVGADGAIHRVTRTEAINAAVAVRMRDDDCLRRLAQIREEVGTAGSSKALVETVDVSAGWPD